MKSLRTHNQSEKGFTLVELAIVLVIIGLLVGGVLAGQDLIKAAQIRNSQNELLTTNTNANTFRNKFGAYPGDLSNSQALGAGFTATGAIFTAATGGTQGYRDGNGLIESPGGAVASGGQIVVGGEMLAFWTDLSSSGNMAQPINTYTGAAIGPAAAVTNSASDQALYFNVLKLRNQASLAVGAFSNRNYFVIGDFALAQNTGAVQNVAQGTISGTNGGGIGIIQPVEAQQFDQKFDDGNPRTGTVVSVYWPATGLIAEPLVTTGTTATTACQIVAATNAVAAYNTAAATNNCSIAVRASF